MVKQQSKTLSEGVDFFINTKQVFDHLRRVGYTVSYNTVSKFLPHITKRRGGGWTVQSVEQFALAMWSDKRAADPSAGASVPVVASAGGSAAEERTQADAELKRIQADSARHRLDRELGKFVETATVEAELGARAKAFRIGLQKFGVDSSERIAAMFGGSHKSAQELARELGLDSEEAVLKIVDIQLSRADLFARLWNKDVEKFLDPYGTGHWWTDDMAAAWDKYEEGVLHADAK